MKKFLKYKYFRRAKSFIRYSNRVLKFNRPKFRRIKKALRRNYKFQKRSLRSRLYIKNYKNRGILKLERRVENFWRYKIKVKDFKQHKVVDAYPISVKINKYIRLKKRHKTKVKLNLVYKLTFGKTLKRGYLPNRDLVRWKFLQKKFFKSYYSISYVLPKLNFYRSFLQVNQRIRYSSILLNGSKIKNSRCDNLVLGDIFELKDNNIQLKRNRRRFINRTSLLPFIELDGYSQNFVVCKDFSSLSRSDAILINPGSKGLLRVNFLKR